MDLRRALSFSRWAGKKEGGANLNQARESLSIGASDIALNILLSGNFDDAGWSGQVEIFFQKHANDRPPIDEELLAKGLPLALQVEFCNLYGCDAEYRQVFFCAMFYECQQTSLEEQSKSVYERALGDGAAGESWVTLRDLARQLLSDLRGK